MVIESRPDRRIVQQFLQPRRQRPRAQLHQRQAKRDVEGCVLEHGYLSSEVDQTRVLRPSRDGLRRLKSTPGVRRVELLDRLAGGVPCHGPAGKSRLTE
jgi:hypothetical protein